MARIRTIKPEFFTSEDIVELTPLSRLFYVSLWCESDREGRLNWKPKTFKLRYFPGDDCDILKMSEELIKAGLIEIYEVNGKTFAEIPSFKAHQVINNRESQSEIPENLKIIDASTTRESGDQGEGKEGRKGKEGKGREVAPQKPKRFKKPTIEEITEFINENNYPVNSIRFFNYYESNGWLVGKNKMKCWKSTVRTWASKETEKPQDNKPLVEAFPNV